MRRGVGREVTSVGDDAVAHESVGFVGGQLVNAFPEWPESLQRIRGKRSGVDESGIVVERAEAGVEVVAVGVDELQWDDGDVYLGHRR